MRFDKFVKSVAPAIAMAMASGAKGCESSSFTFNGKEGVRLSELDLSGDAPDEVNLMGSDIVRIEEGEDFSIALEGDDEAKERMRFIVDGGTLSVLRDRSEDWGDGGRATVTVTMPAPRRLVLAGSGKLYSAALASEAEIAIAGSGKLETHGIDVEVLEVSIAGSGSYRASGRAGTLDLNIAGSGDAKLKHLHVDRANVSIAGSGDASFASDGKVDACLMGSGNVTVRGAATCKVKGFGSGSLTCKRSAEVGDDE